MNKNKLACCPVCQGEKFKRLYEKADYQVQRCRSCGLIMVNPPPTAEELTQYYNSAYQIPLKDFEGFEKKGNGILKMMEKFFPKKGKLLEIGCSFGHFLKMAREQGWETKGIEISEKHARHAQEKWGLEVLTGTLEEVAPKVKADFDLAIFWHVLEHVPEPDVFLKLVREKLAPDGQVFFVVPNGASLLFKLSGKHWEWMTPPAHLFYFSPRTVKQLLKKIGYKDIRIFTRQGDAHDFWAELSLGIAYRFGIVDFLLKRGKGRIGKSAVEKTAETKGKLACGNLAEAKEKTPEKYWRWFKYYTLVLKPIEVLFYPVKWLINRSNGGSELIVRARK